MTNTPKTTNWKTPFFIGIAATIATGIGCRFLFPPVDARTVRLAHTLNIDPHRQERSEQLKKDVRQAATKKAEISEDQWRELKEDFNSSNESLRLEAVSAMMYLGQTKLRETVLGMVHPLLNESPTAQVSALILLRRFSDASWRTEAQNRVNSQDKYLAQMASAMLAQGDIKKK